MLTKDPAKRITLKEVLQDPWIANESTIKARKNSSAKDAFDLYSNANPDKAKIEESLKK